MAVAADVSIGITVFMQDCSFQAELSRQSVTDTIAELDADLTQQGVPKSDTQGRIAAVMLRSLDLSALLMRGHMDQEDGVMEIGCGFLYAFVKEKGLAPLKTLRGLIGCLTDDTLYLNPCVDACSYETLVPAMRQQARTLLGFDDDELIDCTPRVPTLH